jgi:polysaccharide export outer membrane protein
VKPPPDYILGPNDVLEVTVPGLYDASETRPLRVQVMSSNEIHLPLVGAVRVGGLNLLNAQRAVDDAYENGFLENPRVNVALAEKSSTAVVVLGKVNTPGVHLLPKYQNDVGHALAAAGGLTEDADEVIEVHRRVTPRRPVRARTIPLPPIPGVERLPTPSSTPLTGEWIDEGSSIIRIPLRGKPYAEWTPDDVVLRSSDVVVVPSRRHEVFYVVGRLSQTNTVRFTIGDRERELGVGFVLPREREIDVVTAVAMAGYIDPIDSPTTVTVHRVLPDGKPLLIHVDLIKARFDCRETVLVAAGDIIYLNPDKHWYCRRTIDRIIPGLFLAPVDALFRWGIDWNN